jgi:uncharacterized damage-inducible protein DinB
MKDAIAALALMHQRVADEGNWVTTVREAVEGMDAPGAAWKPAHEERSVWEIVRHMTVWTEWAAAFAQGRDTDTEEWPVITDTTPAAWDAERQRLFAAQDALRDAIAALNPETLFVAPVPEVTDTSRLVSIASILLHNAYHAGQITKIRDRYHFYETNQRL